MQTTSWLIPRGHPQVPVRRAVTPEYHVSTTGLITTDLLEEVRAALLAVPPNLPEIAAKAGCTPQTLQNWIDRKVGSCQARKAEAVLKVLGYRLVAMKEGDLI